MKHVIKQWQVRLCIQSRGCAFPNAMHNPEYSDTFCVAILSQGGRTSPMHTIKLTFHSIVDRDIQEVCGSSRILTALVLKFAGALWGAVALLTSYLTFNTGVR